MHRRGKNIFRRRGHVQRDEQQLDPLSQRTWALSRHVGRRFSALGFGVFRGRLRIWRVWCVKLRMCWAAATCGSVLPGCDDGDGCLRALLRADAATVHA
jgi:hypothetical protein